MSKGQTGYDSNGFVKIILLDVEVDVKASPVCNRSVAFYSF